MIRVAREAVVDGVTYQVSAESDHVESAFHLVGAACDRLGAAPSGKASGATGGVKRRTKAEMEAAKAAAASPSQGAPLLGIPPGVEPMRVFDSPAAFQPSQQVVWDDAPPVPQDGKTVAFDGPPPPLPEALAPPPVASPPVKSETTLLCEEIDKTMSGTIALNPAWRDYVVQAYHKATSPHGGDIFAMGAAQLREVLRGVQDYDVRVRATLAQPR